MAFSIVNRPVGDFAGWAATPDVQVVAGDFGGGVQTDIALVNRAPGWSSIPVAVSGSSGFTIQNRPAGDFAAWAATPGVELVTGDFNGDSRSDLALVNRLGGWTTIPVALGDEDGFIIENRPAGDFAAWAATPGVELVTGDFNGDFQTDLALVNRAGGWTTIPVALSRDDGFTIQNRPAGDFAAWAATPGVELLTGDFNGDFESDLALVNRLSGWTTIPLALSDDDEFIIKNYPVGDFAAWATTPGVELVTGDFDGNSRTSRTDIALVNHAPGWTSVPVAVAGFTEFTIENRPAADFAAWAASPNVAVVAEDFNDDGATDLALVNRAPGWTTIPVALGGEERFTVQNAPVGDFARWAATPGVQLVSGDFNDDSKIDLGLVSNAGGWTSIPLALSQEWLI